MFPAVSGFERYADETAVLVYNIFNVSCYNCQYGGYSYGRVFLSTSCYPIRHADMKNFEICKKWNSYSDRMIAGIVIQVSSFSWNVGCFIKIRIPNNGGSSQFVSSSSFFGHVFGSFSRQLDDDKSHNSTRLHLSSSRINRLGNPNTVNRPSYSVLLWKGNSKWIFRQWKKCCCE